MAERVYPLAPRWNPKLGYDEWVETHPDQCVNGHDWTKRRTVRPSYRPCPEHRGGHRIWLCMTPGCDAPPLLDPPIGETCS